METLSVEVNKVRPFKVCITGRQVMMIKKMIKKGSLWCYEIMRVIQLFAIRLRLFMFDLFQCWH